MRAFPSSYYEKGQSLRFTVTSLGIWKSVTKQKQSDAKCVTVIDVTVNPCKWSRLYTVGILGYTA